MSNALKNNIINFFALQVNWFVAIYGASKGVIWPCILITALFAWWQLNEKRRHPNDVRVIICAIFIGMTLDSLWQFAGLVQFVSSPLAPLTPIWLLMLWITFALTFNHSLSWLKPKTLLATLLGFIFSPLTYWGGSRLGGMIYLENIWLVSAILGIAWAIVMYVLMHQANYPSMNIKAHGK